MHPPPSANGAPLSLALQRDARGQLVFTDADGRQHLGVEPIRAFPISDPRHGIALCDAAGRELLWFEGLDDLPPGPRAALEEELARREFMPILRRVVRISAPAEPSEWEVETDRGSTRFDPAVLGYTDEGAYLFNTGTPGNSNAGHDYGTDLSPNDRQELIEYLKTL